MGVQLLRGPTPPKLTELKEHLMADEQPSLHIDTDWKKQAQEEKRKLVEQEAAKKAQAQPGASSSANAAAASSGASAGASAASSAAPGTRASEAPSGAVGRTRERGQVPQANFASLVQSMVTQVLFYLGDLSPRGVEPQINLDMAKYNIDILGVLDEKTKNNLTDEERRILDAALYEARMRYVSVASQYATVG
jgi:hypothetical protein